MRGGTGSELLAELTAGVVLAVAGYGIFKGFTYRTVGELVCVAGLALAAGPLVAWLRRRQH